LIARITPPKFLKANITGAHFEGTQFFSLVEAEDHFSEYMSSGVSKSVGDIGVELVCMGDGAFQLQGQESDKSTRVPAEVSTFQRRLKAAFYSVDLDHVSLPKNVGDFLKKSPPDLSDMSSIFRMPFDAGADPDLKCTPRRR
jgi:hypothetical protein